MDIYFYSKQTVRQSEQQPRVQGVVPRPPRAHAQPPGEDVELGPQQPHLVPQLRPGSRHQGGVQPRVETAPGVDAEWVTLLGRGAAQDRDQPVNFIKFFGNI